MNENRTTYVLFGIWFAALAYCTATVMMLQAEIPDVYDRVLGQVFDAFMPTLALMVTFFFTISRQKNRGVKVGAGGEAIAILICAAYCAALVYYAHSFKTEALTATNLMDKFQWFRTRADTVVAIVIAYYFGKRATQPKAEAAPSA